MVEPVMVWDEHSAAPGEGSDLATGSLSDQNLVRLTMHAFVIDPKEKNAREQLHRMLTWIIRPVRRGQSPAL